MKTTREKMTAIRRIIDNTAELPRDRSAITPRAAIKLDIALVEIMAVLNEEEPRYEVETFTPSVPPKHYEQAGTVKSPTSNKTIIV